jgi:hypothetical protein
MRSFISGTVAAVLALVLCAGGVAAQSKKKKRRVVAKTTVAKTSKTVLPATKTPTETYTGDPVPPPQQPEPGDGVRRITPAEARAAQEKGTAIIVDVRNSAVYQLGHAAGAILIPFGDIATRLNELPRNKMIITYCS